MRRLILTTLIFMLVFCSGCSNQGVNYSSSDNDSSQKEAQIETQTEIQTETQITEAENVYFYGEYVIDGKVPTEGYVFDRMIFFPDGKCISHLYMDGKPEEYYRWYNYSYCTSSNYIGLSADNSSTVLGIPEISEHRNLLQFDDYVLKLVEEN